MTLDYASLLGAAQGPLEEVERARAMIDRSIPDATGIRQALAGFSPEQSFALNFDPRGKEAIQDALGIRPSQDGFFSQLGDFAHSTFSAAVPELVGFEPDRDVQRYRERHPVGGLISQLVGFAGPAAIPFIGEGIFGLKGLQLFGPTARIVGQAATATEKATGAYAITNSFMRGAALESLRWAPFQAGRLAGSTLMAPFGASPWEVVKSVGVETPFFAGIGGAAGWLGARSGAPLMSRARMGEAMEAEEFRLAAQMPTEFANAYDLNALPQTKVHALYTWLETEAGQLRKDKIMPILDYYKMRVEQDTLKSVAKARGGKPYKTHVMPIAEPGGSTASKRATQRIEALFHPGKWLKSMRMAIAADGYPSGSSLDTVRGLLGRYFPERWQAFTQWPREIFPYSDIDPSGLAGRTKLKDILDEHFTRYGDDVWFAREVEDPNWGGGSWIGVRRIKARDQVHTVGLGRVEPGRSGGVSLSERMARKRLPQDRYFIFKTDQPQQFAPGVDSLQNAAAELYVRHRPDLFPGQPEDLIEAKAMAERMVKGGITTDARGMKVDPENPAYLRELVSRKISKRHIPSLVHGSELFNTIDPGLEGLYLTARGAKINQQTGLVDTRSAITKWFDELVPKEYRIAREEAERQLRGYGFAVKQVLAPSRLEMSRNPRAQSVLQAVEGVFHFGQRKAMKILWGDVKSTKPGENFLWKNVLKGAESEGGLLDVVEPAFRTEEGAYQFWEAWLGALTPAEAVKKRFRPEVVKALKALDKVDDQQIRELHMTREALGLMDKFVPTKAHYLISRTWLGDYRLAIVDTNGHPIGYASGRSPKETIEEAQFIIKAVNDDIDKFIAAGGSKEIPRLKEYHPVGDPRKGAGEPEVYSVTEGLTQEERNMGLSKGKRASDLFTLGGDLQRVDSPLSRAVLDARVKYIMGDPKRFAKRLGARGFMGDFKPLSFKQARERIIGNVVETQKLISREVALNLAKPHLNRIAREDVAVKNSLVLRFNALAGAQGPANLFLTRMFDKVLSPHFGAGAVERAVHAMNQFVFFSTLGAGDLGFVTINALTPIQTVLPEIALTLSAPPERLAHLYSHSLFKDSVGNFQVYSFIDNLKLMKAGWTTLQHPEADALPFFERALRDQVISRPFVEAVVGHDSHAARELLKGKLLDPHSGLSRNILNAMQAPIAMSEEFSRGFSFATGWRIARDVFQMEHERAYQFAKIFTTRTNYGYSSAERAKVLTGGLGTGWGLFKNWTDNYIFNLFNYTEEAARGNFKPLLMTALGTGAVGGAVAMPGYGIASGLSELLTDKDLTEWTYDLMGNGPGNRSKPWMADLGMYGLFSTLGVSLQGRAAAPTSSILRDSQMLINTVHIDRMRALGTMLEAGFKMGRLGMNPWDSPDFQRGFVGAFSPRTLQRWYTSQARDALISLRTGNRIMPSPSGLDAWLHVVGITPLQIEKQMDAHNELYEDMEKMRAKIQFYGAMAAEAIRNNDTSSLVEITNRAAASGIPMDSFAKSVQSRRYKLDTDLFDRKFHDALGYRMRQARSLVQP